jgi:hypothetical protein
MASQEPVNEVLQVGCFAAAKTLNDQRFRPVPSHHEKPDVRLGSANVSGQDNGIYFLLRHLTKAF